MPSLKDIRKRISSVKGTQKITKAMKMIAAAKLRKAQDAIINTRPYARRINELIKGLSETQGGWMHPLMIPSEEVKHITIVVLTADKGMCGSFNGNIIRFAERKVEELKKEGKQVSLALAGKKGAQFFTSRGYEASHVFKDVYSGDAFQQAEKVAEAVARDFEKGKTDEVYFLFNEFKSAISQKVRFELFLPLVKYSEDSEAADLREHVYEPGREELLKELVPQDLAVQSYRCLLESSASEHGARMTAMEGATKAASEMIDSLTLQFNRARQAAITKELMDIVGGAEAIK